MYALRKMIVVDTKNLFKNKAWLLLGIFLPIILVALLGFITKPLYGSIMSSYDFYGVTVFLFGTANGATFSANAFLEEKVKGANLGVVFSSVPDYFIPLSKVIATFIFTSINTLISAVVVVVLFQVNFGREHLFETFLLFLIFNFFSCVIGVFVCTLVKTEAIANQITSLVIMILALLGGFFFNISSINETLGKVASYLPFTQLKDLIFGLIYDDVPPSVFTVSLTLGISSIILLFASCILFKGEDYL